MDVSLHSLKREIKSLVKSKEKVVIGIDGQSFSGKTTLTEFLCKTFPQFKHISLDEYMTDAQTRIAACKDVEKRKVLFKYWYDSEKIKNIKTEGPVIIEGIFLLTAFIDAVFDYRLIVTPRENLKELRIKKLMQINNLLSTGEAGALDDMYEKSWQKYEKDFDIYHTGVSIDVSA